MSQSHQKGLFLLRVQNALRDRQGHQKGAGEVAAVVCHGWKGLA